jgi:O-antigen ligase
LRLAPVCFLALAASLPIALISLGKLVLFFVALGVFAMAAWRGGASSEMASLRSLKSPRVLLLAIALFALSLVWTEADLENALVALVKHGKLLVIVILAALIRTPQEARLALLVFAMGQIGLLVASWLLTMGVPLPGLKPVGRGVVFSSYLDQGIIFATSAAVFWHLQPVQWPQRLWPRWLAGGFAIAALASVFLVLIGRSAFVIAAALVGLTSLWAMPARLRLKALIGAPLLVLAALYLGWSHLPSRVTVVATESQSFSQKADVSTSSGWRLNAWQRSAQAIAQEPFAGHGIGAWTGAVKRLQGPNATEVFGAGPLSNPHQEYLLWGVELGVAGVLLLVGLLLALARDFSAFAQPVYRAGVSVVVALAIACMFNSSLYDGLIGDYFCIVLGLLLGLGLALRRDAPEADGRAFV